MVYYGKKEMQGDEPCRGVEVFVWDSSIDKAIKTFSRLVSKEGIIKDFKTHEFFTPKSEKKRRQKRLGAKNAKIEKNYIDDEDPVFKNWENLQRDKKGLTAILADTIVCDVEDEEENFYKFGGRFSKARVFAEPEVFRCNENSDEIQVIAAKVIATLNNFLVVVLDKTKKDRHGNMLYGFPGGKLENPDEGAVNAGEREFKEETGVEISLSPSAFFSYLPVEDKKVIAIATVSLDDLDEIKFKAGEEAEKVDLMTPEEIKKLIENNIFVRSDSVFFWDYLTKLSK